MLVNRETGKALGVTLFETEEEMRRGDEALNALSPGGGAGRTNVDFYEVPVETVTQPWRTSPGAGGSREFRTWPPMRNSRR